MVAPLFVFDRHLTFKCSDTAHDFRRTYLPFRKNGQVAGMKHVLIVGAALIAFGGTAAAHPPANADMSLAPWFRSLRQPGTGMSCCSIADCRPTDFRIHNGHYEAKVSGHWRHVPADTILKRADNPTGRAVVCYTPYLGIMCFIRGPEA